MVVRAVSCLGAAFLTAALVAGPAGAADLPPAATAEPFIDCANIADATQRLACFDAAVTAAREARKAAIVAADATPPDAERRETGGFSVFGVQLFGSETVVAANPSEFGRERLEREEAEVAKQEAPAPLDEVLFAKPVDITYDALGRFMVVLDNGQIWRQIEGDSTTSRFKRNAAENEIRIERGSLGSYNLFINDLNRSVKVRRIK